MNVAIEFNANDNVKTELRTITEKLYNGSVLNEFVLDDKNRILLTISIPVSENYENMQEYIHRISLYLKTLNLEPQIEII